MTGEKGDDDGRGLFTGFIGQRSTRRVTVAALITLTIILFLFNLRRAGERAGRAAERLENLERAQAIQSQMLNVYGAEIICSILRT